MSRRGDHDNIVGTRGAAATCTCRPGPRAIPGERRAGWYRTQIACAERDGRQRERSPAYRPHSLDDHSVVRPWPERALGRDEGDQAIIRRRYHRPNSAGGADQRDRFCAHARRYQRLAEAQADEIIRIEGSIIALRERAREPGR